MAVSAEPIIQAKDAEVGATLQYQATVTTIIDKFTATNHSGATATISVNLVPSGGSAAPANLVTKTKSLLAGESYTFPEVVGHVLGIGDAVHTDASIAASISIRASGRKVTN